MSDANSARVEELAARYEKLKCLAAAVDAELEEIATEVKELLAESGATAVFAAAGSFALSRTHVRVVPFDKAWSCVWAYLDGADPAERERVRADFSECVKVRVTGIDRMIRAYAQTPELSEALKGTIETTESTSETLRFTRTK